MARAETITKLPLDRWAKLLGIHPMHFNGVYDPARPTTPCEQPWMQFAWQAANRVGREEVAQAIADAEADIERELGYRLLPSWETDEWHRGERPWRPELFNLSMTDVRGFAQTVKADWGYLFSGGIRRKTVLPAGVDVAIDYSDVDGDTYDEVATVTGGVAVPVGTDPCSIHVYFPVSNALVPLGGLDEWEIKPINVSVTGALATITFRREQCVLPERYDDLVPPADDSHMRGVDGSVDGNFLEEVDVYIVDNDPSKQVAFLWEDLGIGCACDNGCAACEYGTQDGCLTLRSEPRLSVVAYRPADWNAVTLQFDSTGLAVGRVPDLVRLMYYAGWRDERLACPSVVMDPAWERTVAFYAASKLDRPICECNNVHYAIEQWREDLATATAEKFRRVSERMLDSPFGTRRGGVEAWNKVKGQSIGEGVMP